MYRLLAVAILVAATGCAKRVKSYLNEPQDPTGFDKMKVGNEELRDLLAKCTLHFGFDDADLTAADRDSLEKVAKELKERSTASIRIAGHADERGTEEYNLALGQKRADNARKFLLALGVPASRVEAVTFGEEFPVAEGTTEEAYAENRRDDMGILPDEMIGYAPQNFEGLK